MVEDSLVILGNGFDLHCNLESKFSDYFEYSIKSNPSYKSFYNMIHDDGNRLFLNFNRINYYKNVTQLSDEFSAFDAMFLLLNSYSVIEFWNQIESILKDSIIIGKNFSWEKVFKIIMNPKKIEGFSTYSTPKKDKNEVILAGMIMFLAENSSPPNTIGFNDINDFYRFLLEQLNIFETNFSSYLRDKVKLKSNYSIAAHSLLMQICGTENLPSSSMIFSFNYTQPFSKDNNIFNVHGSLNKQEIIIGIDDCNDKKYCDIFTKTFRRTLLLSKNAKVSFPYFDFQCVNNIYIYGHSFNEQDYSIYFYIFDRLQLVDRYSNITFHLCYSLINKQDESKDLQIKFLRMIKTYSNLINNPLLIHQLSFNSIFIKKI